jgi:hypothetical protein
MPAPDTDRASHVRRLLHRPPALRDWPNEARPYVAAADGLPHRACVIAGALGARRGFGRRSGGAAVVATAATLGYRAADSVRHIPADDLIPGRGPVRVAGRGLAVLAGEEL